MTVATIDGNKFHMQVILSRICTHGDHAYLCTLATRSFFFFFDEKINKRSEKASVWPTWLIQGNVFLHKCGIVTYKK